MQEIFLSLIEQFGYFGIFFLIAFENIFPPIPSELILCFGGFLTTITNLNIVFVILAATFGSLIGAFVLYGFGNIFNKDRLMKIVSGKVGKVLRLNPQDIEKADSWFDHKGNKAVFFCRFIPIVRSLISIPAGMSSMPLGKFALYTVSGSCIWNIVLVLLGSLLGENWSQIVTFMNRFSHGILILVIFLLILGIYLFYRKRSRK